MTDRSSSTTGNSIPVGKVMLWTVPWVALLIGLLFVASFQLVQIPFEPYRWARRVAAAGLVGLAIVGLLFTLEVVGKEGAPWYTNSLLVALVLFWGLCPPAWFFTEYYLIDQETLGRPADVAKAIAAAASDPATVTKLKADYLSGVKVYSDLASKVWVAVGAALATAIGLTLR